MRKLSVGVLNIDQARMTIDLLAALAELPSETWSVQLIVLDNGSTDDSAHVLRSWLGESGSRFEECVFETSGENLGAAGGRNVVLERADGDRILILDNDIVPPADDTWLSSLWRDMDEDDSLAIAGPMLVFADHPGIVQAAGIGLTGLGRVGYLHRGDPVDEVPTDPTRVVASPAACWLLSAEARHSVGLLPEIYHPMQYWDVDYCMQLRAAGWGILCDRGVRLRHIVNVTTKAQGHRRFARTAVRHGMIFRERWGEVLAEIETIEDSQIYWGPIPRT